MQFELITADDPDFKRDLDKFLEGVTGVVEATDCERTYIWARCAESSTLTWEGEAMGLMLGVGKLDGMTISLSLNLAKINGQKIVFFNSPSTVVDHRQIDAWLEKHIPDSAKLGGRINKSNATNFHNVLH